MGRDEDWAGSGLLHPLPVLAVALLIVNDHWLKRAFPGVITGKLSDFAGLAFFPLLLQALWEAGLSLSRRSFRPSRRAIAVAVVATACAFSLAKTTRFGADAYRVGLGGLQWPLAALYSVALGRGIPPPHVVSFTQDATDLAALPALVLPLALGLRRASRARARATAPSPGL